MVGNKIAASFQKVLRPEIALWWKAEYMAFQLGLEPRPEYTYDIPILPWYEDNQ